MTEPTEDGPAGFIVSADDLIAHYDEQLGQDIAKLLNGKSMLAICVTLAGQLGSKAAYDGTQEEWDKFQPTLHYLIKDAGDFTIVQLRAATGALN